jgi:hypothetical protein
MQSCRHRPASLIDMDPVGARSRCRDFCVHRDRGEFTGMRHDRSSGITRVDDDGAEGRSAALGHPKERRVDPLAVKSVHDSRPGFVIADAPNEGNGNPLPGKRDCSRRGRPAPGDQTATSRYARVGSHGTVGDQDRVDCRLANADDTP